MCCWTFLFQALGRGTFECLGFSLSVVTVSTSKAVGEGRDQSGSSSTVPSPSSQAARDNQACVCKAMILSLVGTSSSLPLGPCTLASAGHIMVRRYETITSQEVDDDGSGN